VGVVTGLVVAAAVLIVAAAAGLAWRRREGRVRAAAGRPSTQRMTAADVGERLGERATLLQFSSAFCAPCRATRQLLADVAAGDPGISHIEIDVAQRIDLVRLLDIRRTPTTFVLGPAGQITRRASGLPRRDEVLAAIAAGGQAPGNPTQEVGSDREHRRA
jgi:thiol-disulfide isomerase/thioredoxin